MLLHLVFTIAFSYIHYMNTQKQAGIILHPTSLPGPYGIGELGPQAFEFTDFLVSIGASLWQILPLSPTGYGNSPYSARSVFAGNELLISMELLLASGLIDEEDIGPVSFTREDCVDYTALTAWKMPLLMKAADRLLADNPDQCNSFCTDQADWLDDYALFMTITSGNSDDPRWYKTWETGLAQRNEKALREYSSAHARDIARWKVLQYLFFTQWMDVKSYANSRGIQIIGDVPIFVSADSVDTWTHRNLFKTDAEGAFSFQSGVPPDAFSSTGQLWGMPVYDWKNQRDELFSWWTRRMEYMFLLTDIVRVDHFRGLQAYWEVPAGEKTAENGRWVKVPGKALFHELKKNLGDLPVIAEDLGVITKEVEDLRDSFGFPGMRILQFSFDHIGEGKLNSENPYLPHNYIPNTAAYTGTHDNQTSAGWYASLGDDLKDLVRRYFARPDHDMTWTMIRGVMSSCADKAIVPIQDVLDLGDEGRMNAPATVGDHNWSWRVTEEQLKSVLGAGRFREMAEMYGRMPRA